MLCHAVRRGSFGVWLGAVAGLPPALLRVAEEQAARLRRQVEGRRRDALLVPPARRLLVAEAEVPADGSALSDLQQEVRTALAEGG